MGLAGALLGISLQLQQVHFSRLLLPLLLHTSLLPLALLSSALPFGLALGQLALDTGDLTRLCPLAPLQMLLSCGHQTGALGFGFGGFPSLTAPTLLSGLRSRLLLLLSTL
ncbi:hypothetical protein [Streptomyces sp. NPDC051135]|uniref:hypothetical protein n=1 Tax=unclassified Streptomyces TaxID=2593676 RepID=UPI003434CD9E